MRCALIFASKCNPLDRTALHEHIPDQTAMTTHDSRERQHLTAQDRPRSPKDENYECVTFSASQCADETSASATAHEN